MIKVHFFLWVSFGRSSRCLYEEGRSKPLRTVNPEVSPQRRIKGECWCIVWKQVKSRICSKVAYKLRWVWIIPWPSSRLSLHSLLTYPAVMGNTQPCPPPPPPPWVQLAFWFIEIHCRPVLSHQLGGGSQTDTSQFPAPALTRLSIIILADIFLFAATGAESAVIYLEIEPRMTGDTLAGRLMHNPQTLYRSQTHCFPLGEGIFCARKQNK